MIMTSAICGNHIQILLSELGMLGYPLHYSLHTLTISSSNSVSFPFLEPLICHFVKFLEVRKAAKFLEMSAANIIEARKMESNVTALVSFMYKYLIKLYIAVSETFCSQPLPCSVYA